MARVTKKIWPEYFEAIVKGDKTYELRLADFEIAPGDKLLLKEWDPEKQAYTGRTLEKIVTYVGKTKGQRFYSKDDVDKYGFQVISLK